MSQKVLHTLTQEQLALVTQDLAEQARLEQAVAAQKERLVRMLVMACPSFGSDPAVVFNPRTGEFLQAQKGPELVTDAPAEAFDQ